MPCTPSPSPNSYFVTWPFASGVVTLVLGKPLRMAQSVAQWEMVGKQYPRRLPPVYAIVPSASPWNSRIGTLLRPGEHTGCTIVLVRTVEGVLPLQEPWLAVYTAPELMAKALNCLDSDELQARIPVKPPPLDMPVASMRLVSTQ